MKGVRLVGESGKVLVKSIDTGRTQGASFSLQLKVQNEYRDTYIPLLKYRMGEAG